MVPWSLERVSVGYDVWQLNQFSFSSRLPVHLLLIDKTTGGPKEINYASEEGLCDARLWNRKSRRLAENCIRNDTKITPLTACNGTIFILQANLGGLWRRNHFSWLGSRPDLTNWRRWRQLRSTQTPQSMRFPQNSRNRGCEQTVERV